MSRPFGGRRLKRARNANNLCLLWNDPKDPFSWKKKDQKELQHTIFGKGRKKRFPLLLPIPTPLSFRGAKPKNLGTPAEKRGHAFARKPFPFRDPSRPAGVQDDREKAAFGMTGRKRAFGMTRENATQGNKEMQRRTTRRCGAG